MSLQINKSKPNENPTESLDAPQGSCNRIVTSPEKVANRRLEGNRHLLIASFAARNLVLAIGELCTVWKRYSGVLETLPTEHPIRNYCSSLNVLALGSTPQMKQQSPATMSRRNRSIEKWTTVPSSRMTLPSSVTNNQATNRPLLATDQSPLRPFNRAESVGTKPRPASPKPMAATSEPTAEYHLR